MWPNVSALSLGLARQAEPQHVHRRAESSLIEAGLLAHGRMPAVAADHQIGADRRARPSGVFARTPTTRPPSSIRSVASACMRRSKSG